MKLNDSRIWYIRSADRFSGTIYNFNINVPSFILNHRPDEVIKITLVDFVLKRNKYPIDSNNNRFNVSETQNSVVYNYTITITAGNYNVYQLATQVATQLTNASPYYTYTISWDSISGYYTFTITSKTAHPVGSASFDFNVARSAFELLGFAKSTYSFTSGTLISVKMVSLSGETSIYLRTNLTTPNFDYANGEYGLSDVLAKIPIIVPPYATIVFQDVGASLFNSYIQTNSLGNLNIRLTNSEDIELEFQDEWTCAFKVETYEATKEAEILGELKNLTEINKLNLLQKTIR